MTVLDPPSQKPWYRHFWPWFLMIPPAAAVIGGFLTAYLAGGPPALVVDDYGEIAMATQQRLARDQRAQELGLTARVQLRGSEDGRPQAVSVSLAQTAGAGLPAELVLQLVHPTRAEFDRETVLLPGSGDYQGRIYRPTGRVYVQLADRSGSWRLVGEMTAGADAIELSARPGESQSPQHP